MRALEIATVLIGGFFLDTVFGDPEKLPHPVVWIGKLISFLEEKLRRLFPENRTGERVAGGVLALLVVTVATLIPWGILTVLGRINFWIRLALEIFWAGQILSAQTLAREAKAVYRKVMTENLTAARNQVGRIVGRDTGNLSMVEVIKACVETVAESTSDGVIAPLLFMALFGIPGGFFYKAVNTLDSMVGYRNERYMFFGTISARLDDVMNFIPARVTALLMIIAAPLVRLDGRGARDMWRRDRKKHLSPNSGNPESACAGALGIQLGGDAYYFGERYEKATLGDPDREPEPEDVNRAVRLMYAASLLGLTLTVAANLIVYMVGR